MKRLSTGAARRHAPWYIIPSDHKWFRNYAVAEVSGSDLESFNGYPKAPAGESGMQQYEP